MDVKPIKEPITQKDLINAINSASPEIKEYLLARREYYNLSQETRDKLSQLVDNYQFIP